MSDVEDVTKGFDAVVAELRTVLKSKLAQYGTQRYGEHDELFNLWMCYSDCYRKQLRLQKLTSLAAAGDKQSRNKLISDYKDLANYAIMAVQILTEERDDVHI